MPTLRYDLPEGTLATLRLSADELTREILIAACVRWYAEGRLSQGKAAEIAGLSREDFLDELSRRKVPATQVTLEEVLAES